MPLLIEYTERVFMDDSYLVKLGFNGLFDSAVNPLG
jgi:hypothetical protein